MRPTYENIARILAAEETVSDAELAARLGCKRAFVARVRVGLGMKPKPLPASNARMTRTERLEMFSEPLPGGHRRWLGSFSDHGMPTIDGASVPRIAFQLHHGREPVGRVQPECEKRWCIAGPHQTDRPMRDEAEEAVRTGERAARRRGGPPADLDARRRVAEAFRDGPVPNVAIAKRLGVDRRIVAEVRAQLRLPKSQRSRPQPRPWTPEAFEALTVLVDGGHRQWRGRTTADGVPVVSRTESAYRIAFRLHHGRHPEGSVRHTADCGVKYCVEGSHLNDRAMRASKAGAR
ncbi:hypothetical protein ABZ682_22650 [Streptomyces griseoviridis]|uniref:hypothetical protein n=1 Tax=Streptomyces griseoviridis TaxID=45398 RepID=UPI0034078F17